MEAREFAASRIAIVTEAGVLPLIETLFLSHERVWILAVFFAYSRMAREKLLELGMILNELLIVQERRILTKLFGDLGMAIHEAIHV